MPRRAASAALGLFLLVLNVSAQESVDRPRSTLRAAMRDAVKAKVLENPIALAQPPEEPGATAPLKMETFIVTEKRAPRTAGIDEAMEKEKALEPHALYHTDITKKVRLELGLPPGPGGRGGGFTLPLLRLSC